MSDWKNMNWGKIDNAMNEIEHILEREGIKNEEKVEFLNALIGKIREEQRAEKRMKV